MAPERILCSTSAKAIGGREGHATSIDPEFEVKLSTQPVFRGIGDDGISPAQHPVSFAGDVRQKWQKT